MSVNESGSLDGLDGKTNLFGDRMIRLLESSWDFALITNFSKEIPLKCNSISLFFQSKMNQIRTLQRDG